MNEIWADFTWNELNNKQIKKKKSFIPLGYLLQTYVNFKAGLFHFKIVLSLTFLVYIIIGR